MPEDNTHDNMEDIIENSKILSLEDFVEEAWDYVSGNVVSTNFYYRNEDFIREVNFDLYKVFKNKVTQVGVNQYKMNLTTKECGKILENFFSKLIKFGVIK